MSPWSRVERLGDHHALDRFECGDAGIDDWFENSAVREAARGSCAVHVCISDADDVCGFFALACHQVRAVDIPRSCAGGLTTVPATLLARLGLHVSLRRANNGPKLVMEALRMAVASADMVGSRLVVVDAKSEKLALWYKAQGFKGVDGDPLRLVLKMSAARKAVRAAFG